MLIERWEKSLNSYYELHSKEMKDNTISYFVKTQNNQLSLGSNNETIAKALFYNMFKNKINKYKCTFVLLPQNVFEQTNKGNKNEKI